MDFDKQYNYLILGAGEPHRGKQPAVLCEASPGKISKKALLIAEKNAKKHDVNKRIKLINEWHKEFRWRY